MKHIILLLLLTWSILAQEVGIPYVLNAPRSELSDAVFTANGTNFYTLKNYNQLLRWNFSPLKLIESNKLENRYWSQLLSSSNDRKILLLNKSGKRSITAYSVWDTYSQKIVDNHIIQNNSEGTSSLNYARSVYYVDNRILLLDVMGNMELWDVNTLKMIRYGKLSVNGYGCVITDAPFFTMLTKDKETFVILSTETIHFIDSTTLEPSKKLDFTAKKYYMSSDPYIIYTSSLSGDYKLDINVGEVEKIPDDWIYKHISSLEHIRAIKYNNSIQNESNNVSIQIRDGVVEFYKKYTDNKIAELYVFDNDEWLIVTPEGYFDCSPESRKYLYMKTSSGESVPIDDVTYNKFHKQINLKN